MSAQFHYRQRVMATELQLRKLANHTATSDDYDQLLLWGFQTRVSNNAQPRAGGSQDGASCVEGVSRRFLAGLQPGATF